MFSSLMKGNLRSHIKGRVVISGVLGSGDKGKVPAYKGEVVADWRKVFKQNCLLSHYG